MVKRGNPWESRKDKGPVRNLWCRGSEKRLPTTAMLDVQLDIIVKCPSVQHQTSSYIYFTHVLYKCIFVWKEKRLIFILKSLEAKQSLCRDARIFLQKVKMKQ